jgi:hypothetical protein
VVAPIRRVYYFAIATSLHKGDAEHIRADQQRETANGNGEVDMMHGDLLETDPFVWL